MKSVYLASPFFSDRQKERIYQVKEALVKNKTIDSEKIFIPHEHEYQEAEFGSFEWQKATFQLDASQISAADLVVAIVDYKMEETKENEPDSGTAFEIGFAYGTRTPVAVVQFDPEKEVCCFDFFILDCHLSFLDAFDCTLNQHFDQLI